MESIHKQYLMNREKSEEVRVSLCCNATVREELAYFESPNHGKFYIPDKKKFICNTCDKECDTRFRISSNAE